MSRTAGAQSRSARLYTALAARPRWAAGVLALVAVALALPELGNLDGLGHPDEHFYLSVATDSFDHGGFMPSHDGFVVYQKPPLVFWLARACLTLFGRNAFAARLPGALAAGATVFFGALFATEIAGASAAALAGAFLVAAFGVARFSRELMLDLPLAACVTCALWAFAASAPRHRLAPLWAGFALTLSLGIKGPIGPALIVLCALPPLVVENRERQLRLLRSPSLWAGAGLGALVTLPWFGWAALHDWNDFLRLFIREQYLDRFKSAHGQSPWNLLWGTLLYAAPFWPLALAGAVAAFRERGREKRAEPVLGRGSPTSAQPAQPRLVWPLSWLGAFFLLFLLPREHGLHYPLLILPPLAVLATLGLVSRAARVLPCLGLTLVSLGLLVTLAFPEVPRAPVLLACGAGLLAAWLWTRPSRGALFGASLSTALATHLALATVGPALGRPVLSEAAIALGQTEPVTVYWDHPGPYLLAGGWQAHEVFGADSLRIPIAAGGLILAREHTLAKAPSELRDRLQPLVRWRRSRPYLTAADVWGALRSHDLDALGEWVGLYRDRDHLSRAEAALPLP